MVHGATVLVTGANGFIGSHLVDLWVERGARVRALVRPTSDLDHLSPRAETVFGDVTRLSTLPRALEGATVVCHVAGVVAARRTGDYRLVNEAGTRNLLLATRKAAPDLERFVLVSSLAAAGPSPTGRGRREDDLPRPVSLYGASKLAGERVVLEAAGAVPVTVVRPPIVFGPRDRDMLELFKLVARGIRPVFPREKYYSLCYVKDLVRGIADAATSEAAKGRIYHLADPRAYSSSHLFGLMAEALGVTPRALPVPEPILPLLARASDALSRELGLRSRPLADKVRELRPSYWVADVERAHRELGFRCRTSLREGVSESVRFYRDAGSIPMPPGGV